VRFFEFSTVLDFHQKSSQKSPKCTPEIIKNGSKINQKINQKNKWIVLVLSFLVPKWAKNEPQKGATIKKK